MRSGTLSCTTTFFNEAQLDFDTVEDYLSFVGSFPEDLRGKFEWQAHEFAARVLVPGVTLQAILTETLPAVAERVTQAMHDISDDEPMVVRYAWSNLGRMLK